LIGRLLYDSKSIFEDQYEAIKASSERRGEEEVNLALLTDGLKAEREQGITIDVAYRYFATPKRKFIIADTPGHIQYTRNMVTGASTANVALVLVDARQGIVEQTRRHAFIASLLQIPHLLLCINKMDLVAYDEKVFEKIKNEFSAFAAKLDIQDIAYIPISALRGDNVVHRSTNMPWFQGSTLLYYLETVHIGSDDNLLDARFPVQYVIRPMKEAFHDYRGYAGRVAGGVFRKGDRVRVLPSGFLSKISRIDTEKGELQEAFPPMSVTLLLEDDIDISRGDMIVKENNSPEVSQDIEAMICWFHPKPLQVRGKYIVLHTNKEVKCMVKELVYKLNINTLSKMEGESVVGMNDIARISIRTTQALLFDPYRKNRVSGSFILVDEASYETVAAGMIM
jgi:sulfate adenylyltransferase subunit 1